MIKGSEQQEIIKADRMMRAIHAMRDAMPTNANDRHKWIDLLQQAEFIALKQQTGSLRLISKDDT